MSSLIKKLITTKELIPKCVDCKNFIKHIENGKEYNGLGKCKINGYSLSSERTHFYAFSCRNNDIYCGKDGKYFSK